MALILAFLFWIISYLLFARYVSNFAIAMNNMLYLYFFEITIYILCGLLIGWVSKTKGWLLGIIFGVIIISLLIVNVLTLEFFKTEVTKRGSFNVVKQAASSPLSILIITCSVLGGYLGNKVKMIQEKKVSIGV